MFTRSINSMSPYHMLHCNLLTDLRNSLNPYHVSHCMSLNINVQTLYHSPAQWIPWVNIIWYIYCMLWYVQCNVATWPISRPYHRCGWRQAEDSSHSEGYLQIISTIYLCHSGRTKTNNYILPEYIFLKYSSAQRWTIPIGDKGQWAIVQEYAVNVFSGQFECLKLWTDLGARIISILYHLYLLYFI